MLKNKNSLEIKVFIFMLCYSSVTYLEAREVQAKLSWYNITKLSFRVSGIVSRIAVRSGDYTKKHQKLLNLDQREFTDYVKLTKTLQLSRKSDLDEAQRELERAEELFERTVLSEHELQTIKNKFIISESHYISANINWLKAKRELAYSTLISPFDALVIDVTVNNNETINSSFKTTSAIVLAEADKIAAHFELTADQINKLKLGTIVEVSINGVSYKGTVFFPSLLAKNNLYAAAILLSIPRATVFSGMKAIVYLQ